MRNLYEEVTNTIISLMEKGDIPWHKPWAGTVQGAISHTTGKPYSLLNQILLQKPGEYLTFHQCQLEGGKIRQGIKAKHIYFWKQLEKPETDEFGHPVINDDGKQKNKTIPILKYYSVFHVEDCEGIDAKWQDTLPESPAVQIDEVDAVLHDYVKREGITLITDQVSDSAYYSPAKDLINLPCITQYTDASEYYSTAFHEAVHSTGHPSRLKRFAINDRNASFGSEAYSKEELTAEIGAACILHQKGVSSSESLNNSAAYIQGWLRALRNDKTLIVSAAAKAEKAVKRILQMDSTKQEGEEA